MGSYTFRWHDRPDKPAHEVYVTGTFDDWSKSTKLDKKDGGFEKEVSLPETGEKIYYKFVVDGNWIASEEAPGENDGSNYNNYLLPSDLKPKSHTMSSVAPESTTAALAGQVPKEPSARRAEGDVPHTMSSAAPESTTAALAGQVPKESTQQDDVPGAFPETPAFETPSQEPGEFKVNPLPATSGAGNPIDLKPGEKVPDVTNNTLDSKATTDKESYEKGEDLSKDLKPEQKDDEPTFSVQPIPATSGIGNPVDLAPGEKVPDSGTLTNNTVGSTVTTDKESYEKGGPVIPPTEQQSNNGAGAFSLPPVSNNMIPESSLPMGNGAPSTDTTDPGVTTQSAHPTSTTAALAGEVPKEPRGVPEVVTESQKAAHFDPEASANAEAVQEKKEVEQELLKGIPEAKPTAESSTGKKAGGAAPVNLERNTSADAATAVPGVVSESIEKSHTSPEAAANPEAVAEKAQVEKELEKMISPSEEQGDPAPTATAATSATAPSTEPTVDKKVKESSALSPTSLSDEEPLKSSEELSKQPNTASSSPPPAESNTIMSVPPSGGDTGATEAGSNSALNAPAEQAAAPEPQKERLLRAEEPNPAQDRSRDVSPMTKSETGGPAVTSGVGSTTAPEKSTPSKDTPTTAPDTPKKGVGNGEGSKSGTPASTQTAEDKKKKRRSFFGKLKDKFKS